MGPLYDEFFRGYEAEIGLIRLAFRLNSTYNQSYTKYGRW